MMKFDTSQHMKLGQQMKLGPRMIQSMEILQMPIMALQERIDQELESNIALEIIEPERDHDAIDDDEAGAVSIDDRELVVGEESADGSEDFQRLESMEKTYSEAFDSDYAPSTFSASRMAGERDRKMDAMANISARGESLTEQLLHQWTFADVPEELHGAGRLIIETIGDDGMLTSDLETILEQNANVPGLDLTPELLDEAIDSVQHWLEPPGVGARNRRESLLLQVDDRWSRAPEGERWDDVELLISEHLDDLVQNRLPQIAKATGLTLERINDAMQLMHRLRLAPGSEMVRGKAPSVTPDVLVDFDESSDQFVAALCDGPIPPLRISPRYEGMARDRDVDKETRDFVRQNVGNAQWLIESINQRRSTLLRVVNVVLVRQRDFFDYGPRSLKPLPMIEVAEQLGVHVATVSRAVADKWIQTPRGLFPLRRFFSGGTETDSGKDMSWEAVRATLQDVIDEEDKAQPLSDEALAGELKKRGIEIARRTVVKYRQQLGIPAARRRKTYGSGNAN